MKTKDHSKEAVEIFNAVSKEYQDKYMSVNRYSEWLDLYCDLLRVKNATIFECGCGPGNVTKYLCSKNPKLQVTATDLSENMVALTRKNNPNVETSVFDIRQLGMLNNRYDGIMISFCFPYLNKEEVKTVIQSAYQKLNDKGVLYISTIKGSYEDSSYALSSDKKHKIFIHYYDAIFLTEELEEAGFKIEATDEISYNLSADRIENEIILIATKNIF